MMTQIASSFGLHVKLAEARPKLTFITGVVLSLLCLSQFRFSRRWPAVRARCYMGSLPAATLDRQLLERLYQLRYQVELSKAERDQLLQGPPAVFSGLDLQHKQQTTQQELTDSQPSSAGHRASIFLFIAVFSTPEAEVRRMAVRHAWLRDATSQGSVQSKFVLSGAERTHAVLREAATHADMLFTNDSLLGYRSIIHKTYYVLQYALRNFDVRFVMKADDDTFVNVPGLLSELRACCLTPGCRGERVYFGHEIRNNVVRLGEGDKWQDLDYLNHTSLKTYMPYMMGGGYVLSGDLAKVILGINHQSQSHNLLKFMPNEDVSIGFWLMSVDMRRIDHKWVLTWGHPCCFEPMKRSGSQPRNNRFRVTIDICAEPWIILHKIEDALGMQYLGARRRQCSNVSRLMDQARELAVTARNTAQPPLEPGTVERVDDSDAGQALLGSYTSSPWSLDGRQILAIKPAPASISNTSSSHLIQIGVYKRLQGSSWRWEQLDTSSAWNSRAGPSLQWLGNNNRYALFNDRNCLSGTTTTAVTQSEVCSVVYDLQQMARSRMLPFGVAAVSDGGLLGLSLDFQRLDVAVPGIGYAPRSSTSSQIWLNNLPANDGLWLVDMFSGSRRLLVSLKRLHTAVTTGPMAGRTDPVTGLEYHLKADIPDASANGCLHWVKNPKFNREGDKIVFQYQFGHCFHNEHHNVSWTFAFTLGINGQKLWRIPIVQGGGEHDFGPGGHLLVCDKSGVFEVMDRTNVLKLRLPDTDTWRYGPVHGQYFSQNERFILINSHPADKTKLFIWDRWSGKTHMIGEYTPQSHGTAFQFNGLAPLWSRCGKYVAFDSTHSGQGWHLYVYGVQELGVSLIPLYPQRSKLPIPSLRRGHILVDLGAKRGEMIQRFLNSEPDSKKFAIHAFEPNPSHWNGLTDFFRNNGLSDRATLHPKAAWVTSDMVGLNLEDATGAKRCNSTSHMSQFHQLMAAQLHRWGWVRTGGSDGSIVTSAQRTSNSIQVKAVDFSKWLMQTVLREDFVVLHIDVVGAEFELLQRMVLDGSIMLVDRICIIWNVALLEQYTEWPDFYVRVFELLGIEQGQVGVGTSLHVV